MEIKFSQEYFENAYADAIELTRRHHDEVNLFGDELIVDVEGYLRSQENGVLKVYTARHDNKLIGYCIMYVFRHFHHKGKIHAKQDVLYVDREYRGGLGSKFLNYIDDNLMKLGVNQVHQCVPADKDWSPLLLKLGYKKLETVYTKEL